MDTTAETKIKAEQLSTPTSQSLQAQIDTLAEFSTRLRALRQLPPSIFHQLPSAVEPFSVGDTTRRAMSELQSVRSMLLEDKMQTALKAAQESEARDRTGVRSGRRRETRKRKRSPTPESPKPYVAPKARTIFPSSVGDVPVQPLTLSTLPEYVREFNRRHAHKVSIRVWCRGGRTGSGPEGRNGRNAKDIVPPVVLRLTIPDVLKSFVTLDVPSEETIDRTREPTPLAERPLMVENVTVFGAREKQPPHSQSEYSVFQKTSQ
ncbi:hypothetical protein OF83DRAFT_415606 [Amylostereum chailletii]|nr:hypothetical protein OF83DRAFT_415606 [Amylostereum chailletii]